VCPTKAKAPRGGLFATSLRIRSSRPVRVWNTTVRHNTPDQTHVNDKQQIIRRAHALIARAIAPTRIDLSPELRASTEREAYTAAMLACRMIHQHGLLSDHDQKSRQRVTLRRYTSKFDGTCWCGQPYHVGYSIFWSRGYGCVRADHPECIHDLQTTVNQQERA
jgi:hypothetical protein